MVAQPDETVAADAYGHSSVFRAPPFGQMLPPATLNEAGIKLSAEADLAALRTGVTAVGKFLFQFHQEELAAIKTRAITLVAHASQSRHALQD